MDIATIVVQVVIALGIVNVWVLRFGRATAWRGGEATTMREEFETYGLPVWFMFGVGALKLTFAGMLVAGIWLPQLVQPAAFGMALLMTGAVVMHIKVGDPPKKSAPALSMLLMSLFVGLV
jgi:hypothetical protein